ncbi:unnamed protein product [Rhizophagus irregularis]|nr:unnamed protein product [Rhizophagus irregularis]
MPSKKLQQSKLRKQPLYGLDLKNNTNIISQDARQFDAERVRAEDLLFDEYFSKKNNFVYKLRICIYNNNNDNNNNNAILKYPTKIPFDPLTGRIIKKISLFCFN